ncbi:16956_t:CDS:2, partial [Funneliformis geosporum]
VDSFTPVGRYAHSSALIRNKLVFFGGINDKGFCLNEVFYLDLSRSFNIVTPPWIDLTLNSRIPFKSCWGTVSPNDKEQIIYLFGGIMFNATDQDFFVSVVHSFNLNSLSWNIPNVKGITPKRRRNIQSVIDNYGKMYIFGGYADNDLGLETSLDYNDMVILNTVELSWENYIINSPKHRDLYTATLLTSGVIVYIGGFEYGLDANVTTNSKPSITTQSSPTASIIAANYESKFVTMKIIVASIGGILGLVIIIVSGFLIFRWNVKRKALPPRHINEEHTLPGDIVEHDRSSYILAY